MSPVVIRLLLVACASLPLAVGIVVGWQGLLRARAIAVAEADAAARSALAFDRLVHTELGLDERAVGGLFGVTGRPVSRPDWPKTLGELLSGNDWGRLGGSDVWWWEYELPGPPGRVAVAFTAALSDHRCRTGVAVAKRVGTGPIVSLFGNR